jgi:hypothetical protein
LHATRERGTSCRLDDQVHVVRLHGEVIEAEAETLSPGAEGAANVGKERLITQARKVFAQA